MGNGKFVSKSLNLVSQLAVIQEVATGLAGVYTSRKINSTTNPITVEDLKTAGSTLTPEQYANAVTVVTKYIEFCNTMVDGKTIKELMNLVREDI